jgi:EAL domain-containing protein (putative c-di-GMP-specific phosphodiesterase class I)
MSRELAIRHRALFPGAETSTITLSRGRRQWRDRPGVTLLFGAIATSVLVALELANAGGEAAAFQYMYTTTAAATATAAMIMLARRPVAGFLRYRTLAWAIGCTGLAMALLSLAPVLDTSLVVAAANVLFICGGAMSTAVIAPALYRHLDRHAVVTAVLDGGIMLFAGITLMLTMWRTGRGQTVTIGELAVPMMAAGLAASAGVAAIAALTKRAAPGLGGIWCGIAGVWMVGLSWVLWVDLIMHGQVRNAPTSILYSSGILLLGYAWMTWNEDIGVGKTYELVARTLVDWLPIGAILLCVVVAAVPHGSVEGVDPALAGTAVVVLLSIARQRMLIVRERWASHRLTGEIEERAQTMLSLARLERAETLGQTAMLICAEALRLDGIGTAGVYVFGPTGGTLPLALTGEHRDIDTMGEPIGSQRSHHLRASASTGAWIDTPGPEAATAAGQLLGEAFAPLRWDDRIIGVVSMGTTNGDDARRLAQRLPTLAEFGVVSAALLGPMLTDHWRLADTRCQLDSIISSHAFLPVFQPVVQLQTREILGFEALTRFRDGARPDQRFAEANTAGMSVKLEMACLREQLEAASWLPPGLWVSLNVSPALATAIVPLISALERADRDVILEITEHVEIADYRQLVAALELVRGKVRLAVDDAGAGYAGLRHILELRPQFVKLDLSLIRHVNTDPARQAMVAGMAHFARNSDCELIAEGIETEEELNELIRLGIGLGQGYLFGKPGPVTMN